MKLLTILLLGKFYFNYAAFNAEIEKKKKIKSLRKTKLGDREPLLSKNMPLCICYVLEISSNKYNALGIYTCVINMTVRNYQCLVN